jgi:hypothetical protein
MSSPDLAHFSFQFFSITRFPLYARISDRAKAEVRHIKVTLQGLHLHEDIDYLHAKGLIPSSESGLGWMGVFSESDYIRDDTISFSSYHYGCGLVHLGMKQNSTLTFLFDLILMT